MASVTWDSGVKIAPVSDLSDETDFLASDISDDSRGRTNVETAVDGTLRSFVAEGVPRTFRMSAQYASRTVFESLQGLVGSLCQFRGPAGRVVYGVVDQVDGRDESGPKDIGVASVNLSVSTVTYTPVV